MMLLKIRELDFWGLSKSPKSSGMYKLPFYCSKHNSTPEEYLLKKSAGLPVINNTPVG